MHRTKAYFFLFALAACAAPLPEADEVGKGHAQRGGGAPSADETLTGSIAVTSASATTEPPSVVPPKPKCAPTPRCDAEIPTLGARRPFSEPTSKILSKLGARHRGRDTVVKAGDRASLIARFAYGLDNPLENEDVDLFLDEGCAGSWKPIGRAKTSKGDHGAVEGVPDDGGRVFAELPTTGLALGRHRVALTAAGDGSIADLVIDVVAPNTPILVSDVDGTLTIFEEAEYLAAPTSITPPVKEGATEVLGTFAKKGYRIAYVTARPEWLTGRTRELVSERGLPPGIVRTSATSSIGMSADQTVAYKSSALSLLAREAPIAWLFGNTLTDAQAYATTNAPPERRIFIDYAGDTRGGRSVKGWKELVNEVSSLPAVCE